MTDKLNQVAVLLRALAHPTSIQLVNLLNQTPQMNVTELIDVLRLDQSLVSHHLLKLKDKGVLSRSSQQNHRYYALADPVYVQIIQLMQTVATHMLQEDLLFAG